MPNRVAEMGEELVLHRFETATLQFASLDELMRLETAKETKFRRFWNALKECLVDPSSASLAAVRIPPGTRLLLTEVPRHVQQSLRISASEIVAFTEVREPSYAYRDALVLQNGTRVLLQDLPQGLHAIILSVSPDADEELVPVRGKKQLHRAAA
jgi:hypothetical protein